MEFTGMAFEALAIVMFPGPLLSDPKTLIFYRVAQIQWEGESLCPRNISYLFTIILAVALFSLVTHAFW